MTYRRNSVKIIKVKICDRNSLANLAQVMPEIQSSSFKSGRKSLVTDVGHMFYNQRK